MIRPTVAALVFGTALIAQVPGPETTTAPAVKARVEPKYTKEALEAGVTGTAMLTVRVDKTGMPTSINVRWKGGDPHGLDVAAVEAIKKWRFYPQIRWGKPAGFPASIELEFDYDRHPEQLP
jgi:TonB family protein